MPADAQAPQQRRPQHRRSGRVILLSPDDEVLLIEFLVPRSTGEFRFWATPGGGAESGETDLDAARRELREELQLALDLEGPVHTVTSTFEHQGALIVSADVFFLARCERAAPRLTAATDEERAVIRGSRWWTLDDIATAKVAVFPEDLAGVVQRLLR